MRWTFIILFAGLLALSSVFAATCPTISSKNTDSFFQEIPSIQSQLSGCPIALPSGVKSIVSNGPLQVDVTRNAGGTDSFSLTISKKQITSINKGAPGFCKQKVTISENDLDTLLSSSSRGSTISWLVANKRVTIGGCTFWNKVKLFFVKPVGNFVAKKAAPAQLPPATNMGKPDNCDDTWMPGHRGYAENKALWDGYSSDTDGVCQSQYGRGIPSPCVHTVQLSVSGNPYYLCWYNN